MKRKTKFRGSTTRLKENFPIHLPYKGDIVLDPFMGIGTTAVASERLNRKWTVNQ